ncbi:MAG: antibiotic biosynthesis monooxygenase [Planctomycetaceae bacterium]|nr:antibiotic biosynthesis monooxygenase [Planctomycetaceae bacterium]MCA9108924.1 antibiotic biosynthesis monooxygenase [Planctomycetaceae bacterium]
MIHVIATIQVADGRRDEFLKIFRELMPKVHAEDGCIEYAPAIDIDTGVSVQSMKGENTVTIMEKWESVEKLKAHLSAPHMVEYRDGVQELVQGVTLNVLQPA